MVNTLSSGIDVNAMVSALMDVEKIPLGRMEKSKAGCNTQLSNFTHLNNLLTQFQDNANQLNPIFNTHAFKANASDETVFSTVLSGNVQAAGVYPIDITTLATAHQVASGVYATKNSALNLAGSLVIETGANNLNLTIEATDSLESIRDHINQSLNNKGVNASILTTTAPDGSAQFRLILTSKETGLAQRMTLSGDALGVLDLTHELTAAQDADFTFDGFHVVRSSNTISDLLDGVTLTLNASNRQATLTILPDEKNRADNIKKGITSVIEAYNALIDLIDRNQSLASTRDNTYTIIKSRLKQTMEQPFGTGAIKTWLDVGAKTLPAAKLINEKGVEYVSTGKLTVDAVQNALAIHDNDQSITDFFTLPGGFIETLQTAIQDVTATGGIVSIRENSIKHQESAIDNRINREESRLAARKESLTKQYANLDTFIQHYQQISNFLEQQIDSMKPNRSR